MKRLLVLLAACSGQSGTIQLELTEAPGGSLIADIQHLRVTLTDPLQIVEADRGPSGFNLALDVDASGATGSLVVEGFDASDGLVATGASPPFPVAAINARIVIYMATPMSIGAAPEGLPAARTGVASAALTYGLVMSGGVDTAGATSDSIFIYNAYDHSLVGGIAMPAPRSQQTLAVGTNNGVSLFGGLDANNAPTGTLWRFDTTVPPNGSYQEISDDPAIARAGAVDVPLGLEHHIFTGAPTLDLSFQTVAARTDLPQFGPAATSVAVGTDLVAVFGGDPVRRLQGDTLDMLPFPVDAGATPAALPGGRVAFVGTGQDIVVVDAATGAGVTFTAALSKPRSGAAVAATDRFLVVAGGLDEIGNPIATADVLDVTSLALVVTIPCEARSGARAYSLGNGQIAIVGGAPATGTIELFTPPPAE